MTDSTDDPYDDAPSDKARNDDAPDDGSDPSEEAIGDGPVEDGAELDSENAGVAPPAGRLPPGARAFFDWVVVVAVALLVATLVRTFLLAHYQVEGTSMLSTLNPGDRVFVNKMSYRLHDPNRGDVVVLHELTGTTERDLIKRVIALPDETIEIVGCEVFIDGLRLDEPYLDPAVVADRSWCTMASLEVPDGHVFVLGDNRPRSTDSRSIGPIADEDLVGRAFVVFWPRADWQWL